MKCLTIREPYASLIKNNIKHIETRSWNTTYRGKIYIHAGVSKLSKNLNQDLQKLIKDLTFSYGEIICECELTDVIYMTKEYIEDIRVNHYEEYICGDFQVGRYAWVLENVKPLDKPIKTKGRLSIWNYYDEKEIVNILKDIEYGWLDKNKKINYEINDFCIGGGMSEYSKYFIDEIRKNLPNINICIAKYKNDSGIIGAALLEKIKNYK